MCQQSISSSYSRTPKEKELKYEGRYFGQSHLLERNRRVVQEANAYSLLNQYITEEILTVDETSLLRKLYSFHEFVKLHPTSTVFHMSLDFQAWNNYFRDENVDTVGKEILDPWFGTSWFGKTMKFYQSAFFTAPLSDSETCWQGQMGGIEGLNQGTWELAHLGALKKAIESLGYPYTCTVKGDDVRISLAIPNEVI